MSTAELRFSTVTSSPSALPAFNRASACSVPRWNDDSPGGGSAMPPCHVLVNAAPIHTETKAEEQFLQRQPRRSPCDQIAEIPNRFDVAGPQHLQTDQEDRIQRKKHHTPDERSAP